MNKAQELWWKQAHSDWRAYQVLRKTGGVDSCHELHFLQMAAEKISKAYLLRTFQPKRSHAGFGKFLRLLIQSSNSGNLQRIARIHQFNYIQSFEQWIHSVRPLADDLEKLAPALAKDGPNPEYPWPHDAPKEAPALYHFPLLERLELAEGRSLLRFLEVSVKRFPEYVDL
jgi:hypothetical protein